MKTSSSIRDLLPTPIEWQRFWSRRLHFCNQYLITDLCHWFQFHRNKPGYYSVMTLKESRSVWSAFCQRIRGCCLDSGIMLIRPWGLWTMTIPWVKIIWLHFACGALTIVFPHHKMILEKEPCALSLSSRGDCRHAKWVYSRCPYSFVEQIW